MAESGAWLVYTFVSSFFLPFSPPPLPLPDSFGLCILWRRRRGKRRGLKDSRANTPRQLVGGLMARCVCDAQSQPSRAVIPKRSPLRLRGESPSVGVFDYRLPDLKNSSVGLGSWGRLPKVTGPRHEARGAARSALYNIDYTLVLHQVLAVRWYQNSHINRGLDGIGFVESFSERNIDIFSSI